jgi:hypothetical protein
MRRHAYVLVMALVALLTISPAAAVTDGVPDGGAHPYVGLVVFHDAAGHPTHRCSGTLLSATVFLTAGHCTVGTTSAQVWFDETVTPDPRGYPLKGGVKGDPYTHPSFVWTLPNTSDVGIVLLRQPQRLGTGALPALGTLDALAGARGQQAVTFTVVGYGLQEVKPVELAERTCLQATVQLVNLRSALTDGYNIHHTNAPGTGGGTCFGDSGGPVFNGTSNEIVAITSFGLNENCVGADFAYRTDIANAQDFINGFL